MKKYITSFLSFVRQSFEDNGLPSSSRLLSAWLSLSSMSLIWWTFHHMMFQPADKLQVWIGGMPMIIGALATFAASPYGINRLTNMLKKEDPPDKDGSKSKQES